jgi:hypothetical protein
MQALDRQIKSFVQHRLADALFLEDLGVDIAGLLSAFKLILLELEQVSTNIVYQSIDGKRHLQACLEQYSHIWSLNHSSMYNVLQTFLKGNCIVLYLCADLKSILQAQKDICDIKEEAAHLIDSVQTLQRETDEKFDKIFLAMGMDPSGLVASAAEENCRLSKDSNAAGVMDHSAEMQEDLIGENLLPLSD